MGSEEGGKWSDVTAEFRSLVAKIPPSELLCMEGFQLDKVMHTAEAMDKKMDIGMGFEELRTMGEVIDGGAVNEAPTDDQVLALMRFLLRAECSLLQGTFLHTNMLLCIYFHRLEMAQGNKLLHDYLTAICVSTTNYVHMLERAEVTDDEELTPCQYKCEILEAATKATSAEAMQLLEVAAKDLRKKERLTLTDRPGESADERRQREETTRQQMLFFLEFREHYLRLQDYFDRRLFQKKARGATGQLLERLRKARTGTFAADAAAPTAPRPKTGADAVAYQRPRPDEEDPLLAGMVFAEATTWLAQYKAIVPALPTIHEAIGQWEQIFTELQELCSLESKVLHAKTKDHREGPCLKALVDYAENFSARKTRPHLMSRGYLMLVVYDKSKVFGKWPMVDVVLKHITEHVGAPLVEEAYKNPKTPTSLAQVTMTPAARESALKLAEEAEKSSKQLLKTFLGRFSTTLLMYIYALMHNRSRLRRKLCNLTVDWGWVQSSAWECDRFLFDGAYVTEKEDLATRTTVLLNVVNEFALQSMSLFLSLGHELELYSIVETCSILWYTRYVEFVKMNTMQALYLPESPEDLKFLKAKKGVAGKIVEDKKFVPPSILTRRRVEVPEAELGLLMLHHSVLSPLVAVCNVLQELNILREPWASEKRGRYCTHKMRYNERLAPFHALVKPAFVPYETYQSTCKLEVPPLEQLKQARQHFESAQLQIRNHLARVAASGNESISKKLEELAKVAKANCLSLMLMTGEIESAGENPHEKVVAAVDWSHSSSIPVLLVKPVGRST